MKWFNWIGKTTETDWIDFYNIFSFQLFLKKKFFIEDTYTITPHFIFNSGEVDNSDFSFHYKEYIEEIWKLCFIYSDVFDEFILLGFLCKQ